MAEEFVPLMVHMKQNLHTKIDLLLPTKCFCVSASSFLNLQAEMWVLLQKQLGLFNFGFVWNCVSQKEEDFSQGYQNSVTLQEYILP